MSVPIAFFRQDDKTFVVMLQGLEPGTNLLVSSKGHWQGRYIPEKYQIYPFLMARNESGEKVLCIDESAGTLLPDGDLSGELFFDGLGQPSEKIGKVVAFLSEHGENADIALEICRELEDLELLEPWEIKAQLPGKQINVSGLFRINEPRLNALGPEDLLRLRDSRALAVAYCQLFSTANLDRLIRVASERESGGDDSYSLANTESSGSLSFDNI